MAEGSTNPPEEPAGTCLACGSPLKSVGVEEFRVGGLTGGLRFLIGNWGTLDESLLSFEVLACTACRRVELRTPK